MCYASSRDVSPILVFHDHDLDKTKADVDQIILVVRTAIAIKARRLPYINSVCVDQFMNSERSDGEAEQSQNPPHILNIFIVDTA
jgi:ABC-type Mn2+/Zn2+ transport system ATPase subunit